MVKFAGIKITKTRKGHEGFWNSLWIGGWNLERFPSGRVSSARVRFFCTFYASKLGSCWIDKGSDLVVEAPVSMRTPSISDSIHCIQLKNLSLLWQENGENRRVNMFRRKSHPVLTIYISAGERTFASGRALGKRNHFCPNIDLFSLPFNSINRKRVDSGLML